MPTRPRYRFAQRLLEIVGLSFATEKPVKSLSRSAWLLAILPACAAVVGCGRSQAPQGMPPQEAPTVSVSTPVVKSVMDYEDFPGRIEATNSVEIRARVTGYLNGFHFREGDEVKKGDLLFEIDARPYEAELARARGSILLGQGRLDRLELDYRRASDLMRRSGLSREDFDKVVGDRTEAVGTLDVSKAALAMAQLNLEWTKVRAPLSGKISRRFIDPGNLVKADETPLTTIVSLDPVYAYFDLDERSTLYARRLLREGTVKWTPASPLPMLLGLADEERAWRLRVWVDPAKATARGLTVADVVKALRAEPDVHVADGQTAAAPPKQEVELSLIVRDDRVGAERFEKVVVKSGSEELVTVKDVGRVERGPRNVGFPRRGLIDFADNRVDADTGTWRLRATCQNPDQALYPGLYVRIRLPIGNPREAVLVSQQAVGIDQGQQFLYVLESDKDKDEKNIFKAAYRPVKVGRLHDGLRVITEGLKKDEKVVVNGLQRVRPGSPVRPEDVTMPVLTSPQAGNHEKHEKHEKKTKKEGE